MFLWSAEFVLLAFLGTRGLALTLLKAMESSDSSTSGDDENLSTFSDELEMDAEEDSPERPYKYKHKCHMCPKAFGKARDLAIHIRRHRKCKPHACKDCRKTFCTPFELEQHVRSHTGERPFKCSQCSSTFSALSTLHRHATVHRTADSVVYRCSMCPSTFLYATTCSAHERTHHTNCAYKCKMCNRTFSQKYNLERHMKLHKGGEVYRCAICERSFCNQERLDTHRKSCTELHKCTVCGKGYREKAQLEAHIASQHDLTSEPSEEDGESADHAANSSFDQERADDDSSSDDDVTASNGTLGTDQEQTGPAWSVRLRTRGTTNPSKAPARLHRQNCRNGVVSSQNPQCSRRSVPASPPQKHATGQRGADEASTDAEKAAGDTLKSTRPVYKCPGCERPFPEWDALKAHAAHEHKLVLSSSTFQFVCHICDKAFKQNSNLKTHLKSHDKVVLYECDICGLGFTLKHHYTRHRSNKHYID